LKDFTDIEQRMSKIRPKLPSAELMNKVMQPPLEQKGTSWFGLIAAIIIVATISWREYESYQMKKLINPYVALHQQQQSKTPYSKLYHLNKDKDVKYKYLIY